MTRNPPLISVCICTYRRPHLLDALLATVFNDVEMPGPTEIVVVDNDPNKSAERTVEKYRNREIVLKYFHEPIQNISLARNKSIENSQGKWLAMIDDDERPDPDWLSCFHRCALATNADAVFGPVLPEFPATAPRWIVDGRYFDRKRYPNGKAITNKDARTSNVFLKAEVISGMPGPFDPDFGLSGGEDSLLFGQLFAEGKHFYWCDDAIVTEYQSEDRLTWKWLVKRSFRTGQTTAYCFLNHPDLIQRSLFQKSFFFMRSTVIFMTAIPLFLFTYVFGKKYRMKWLRIMASQAGKMCPLSFYKYQPYEEKIVTSDSPIERD